MTSRTAAWASAAVFAALVAWQYEPILRCLDSCMVDYVALRGGRLGKLELPDARLNSWILAWVQHSLLHDPLSLFDANIFYPVRHALTQSEHLLTMAVGLLPLRPFTTNAPLLHQVALMLSSFLLALTTAALVRWLCGSAFAAALAGAAALFMPWRYSEISHVQLMNAQWFPLVWLAAGRIVSGDTSRRAVLLLTLALTLQVLSSFYLAYFLAVSCAAALAGVWARDGLDRAAAGALARACALPALALGAVALPYLGWGAREGFVPLAQIFDSVSVGDAVAMTRPLLTLGPRAGLPREISYEIPLAVFALGLAAFGRARAGDATDRRRATFAWALAASSAACFVLMLGRTLEVGSLRIPLPARWAAALVPGFENLRNPLRWAIPIGVAFPVLAGVGAERLERGLLRRTGAAHASAARWALRAALVAALALSLPSTRIPARDAWEGQDARLAGWRALGTLPRGPVIELPWPLQPQHDIDTASLYMLGSTLHWQPLANGTSGYIPLRTELIRQMARGLPSAAALAHVRTVLDLRYLLVHLDGLPPHRIQEWRVAVKQGRLRRVYADEVTWILEVPDWQQGGPLLEAFADPTPRPLTLSGLPRDRLTLDPRAGRITAQVERPFHFAGARRLARPVSVTIVNRTDRPWPGFDIQTEGLVRLRYAFVPAQGEPVLEDSSALAHDVPAHTQKTIGVPIAPPARAGAYRLRLELVQRLDGEERPLGLAPYELDVEVREASVSSPSE